MNVASFGQYSRYYDLLYRDKDYPSEAAYVARTLRSHLPAAKTILEFGAGTGRHGRLLSGHGFDVLGVERSETMVTAADESTAKLRSSHGGGSFQCRLGDIRSVNVGRTFDAVVALFHVISYQTTNSDLSRTFGNAARHLRSGGVFLFDVWHGPAVLTERPSVRVKQVEDDGMFLTRLAEPELDTNTSVVTVRYTMLAESKPGGKLTRVVEEHRMRYLFPTEIDLLATNSGFKIERQEEFVAGKPASETTWGVVYVLRKV